MAGPGMQHRRVQEEDDGTSDWPDRRNPVVQNEDSDSQYESDGSEDPGDSHGACVWNGRSHNTWTMHNNSHAGTSVDVTDQSADLLFSHRSRRHSWAPSERGRGAQKCMNKPTHDEEALAFTQNARRRTPDVPMHATTNERRRSQRGSGVVNNISRASDEGPSDGGLGSQPKGQGPAVPKNGAWSTAQLQRAKAAHERGMSLHAAATTFEIPKSSLRSHIVGKVLSRKRGAATVLSPAEEQQLVDYILAMQDLGFPVSISQLKLKVAFITQGRDTPFTNGIPGPSWLRWFRRRHPNLSLRLAQGLDNNRAKSLCETNVKTFYDNLRAMYEQHNYPASHVWNCDESGVQAGRNGGAYVLAKTGSRSVHQVIPDQREWLTVLTCINADGQSIPSFYIFRGKRFRRNYIQHCEEGATMAMSNKAWMTAFLFAAWIDHFILALKTQSDISVDSPHLLIMDGHSSHITMDVVCRAREVGLHLLTLPSHCSHAMQPLDVSIFKPFKGAFRVYRDIWTLHNNPRKSP